VPVTTVTTKITVTSMTGPQEAIEQATAIATAGLAEVEDVKVKQAEVVLEDGNITGYRVTVEIAYGGEEDLSPGHEDRPDQRTTPEYASPVEFLRAHVLLEDLSEDKIGALDRSLTITPAKRGSGHKDVSTDHDRYLAGD
jgi:flavin-binding protein dodecin